mmetsp:Transcript_4601/g.9943  ORF Transcript_4601/g.9943 Transcript_4601/m.9943 type:complete len:226 (-) Transcript_4601:574-1251(-)
MVLSKSALEGPAAPYRSAAFGVQSYSGRHSGPLYSFGTSTVEARANEYLGKEFCPHQVHLATSPGPGTYSPSDRAASHGVHPGPPGSRVSLRWSSDTTQSNPFGLPSHSFKGTPGPGRYHMPTSTLGVPLPSAACTSPPRFSWSRASTRESNQSVYVTRGHERERLGFHSPGPHTVGPDAFSSIGRQLSSKKRTNPTCAMSRAQRFLVLKGADPSRTPGPGQYNY